MNHGFAVVAVALAILVTLMYGLISLRKGKSANWKQLFWVGHHALGGLLAISYILGLIDCLSQKHAAIEVVGISGVVAAALAVVSMSKVKDQFRKLSDDKGDPRARRRKR